MAPYTAIDLAVLTRQVPRWRMLMASQHTATLLDGGKELRVDGNCRQCSKPWTLQVDAEAYKRWCYGEYVQSAFPQLSSGQRELLISGVCEPCFDEMFKEV